MRTWKLHAYYPIYILKQRFVSYEFGLSKSFYTSSAIHPVLLRWCSWDCWDQGSPLYMGIRITRFIFSCLHLLVRRLGKILLSSSQRQPKTQSMQVKFTYCLINKLQACTLGLKFSKESNGVRLPTCSKSKWELSP